MFKYLVRRLTSLIPVVIVISIMLFGLVKLMPADPARGMVNPNIKDPVQYQLAYEAAREKLGLDKSIPEQYVRWVGSVLSGDLGQSIRYNKPVTAVIGTPLKNTIFINVFSLIISFLVSIYVGIRSAVKRGGLFDRFWQFLSLVGMSMPTLLISILLIYFFAIKLGWFPISGMPTIPDDGSITYFMTLSKYAVLPIATLTIGSFAGTIRYVRSAMIDVLNSDYIRTARAKGLSSKVVIYSHAFRNALIPVVTLFAGSIAGLFGGAAITEQIFSWNGIGRVLIESVNGRDFMLLLALNMFYAVLSLAGNIIMDLGYALVDPRVKLD